VGGRTELLPRRERIRKARKEKKRRKVRTRARGLLLRKRRGPRGKRRETEEKKAIAMDGKLPSAGERTEN